MTIDDDLRDDGALNGEPHALTDEQIAFLTSMGIEREALAQTWFGRPEPVWADRVKFFKAGGFEFDKKGQPCFIFQALDCLGDELDMVAWHPKTSTLQSWRNRATLLGEENLELARLRKTGGLPIYRSPLGWLRNKRYGIVIVIPRYAARRLLDHGPFQAEDKKHLYELRKLLTLHPPEIVLEK